MSRRVMDRANNGGLEYLRPSNISAGATGANGRHLLRWNSIIIGLKGSLELHHPQYQGPFLLEGRFGFFKLV